MYSKNIELPGVLNVDTREGYAQRQWRKSVVGQIWRGVFLTLAYYPARALWWTAKKTTLVTLYGLGFAFVITRMMLGWKPKDYKFINLISLIAVFGLVYGSGGVFA